MRLVLFTAVRSDFVTNSYGESWDSSWEKSWVPVHNQWVPVKKNTRSPKLKMLGPLCNQTINLETDAKTLFYSLLKLKYSPPMYLKHKKDQNKYASLSNNHWNHMNRIFSQKIFKLIDCSLCPLGHRPWIILHLWGFLCVRDAGCRGNKITV